MDISAIDTIDRRTEPIPVETMLELRDKNLTYDQIGKILGISKQAVQQRLKQYSPIYQRIEQFKKHRGDILTWKQAEILNALTPAEIQKAPPAVKSMMFGIFYDKERLERNQSTENISIKSITQSLGKDVEEIARKRAELMKMMDDG